MIISENREKVKRKAIRFVNKLSDVLSKPERKFVLEMLMGILITGSVNLTRIAGSLNERILVKDTLKRLLRMLMHEEILEISNEYVLAESVKRVNKGTILALDSGDISHQYGEKFERAEYVKDGSSGEIRKGYWLNQVCGYNPVSGETFPMLLDIYSVSEVGMKSANSKAIGLLEKVFSMIGSKGLWVLDRGYDNREIFNCMFERSLDFIVRMKSQRDILIRQNKVNIYEAASDINRRINYGYNSRFGSQKCRIEIKGNRYEVTLISFKDKRNKEIIYFLTNGWIKSTKELKRRIRGYFHRWGVEESYRFEKQGFGIERSIVRRYPRIKTLIGLSLLAWHLLIKVNDNCAVKESVLKAAKMEKEKIKQRPKFIYYRLLRGIQNLFAGIRCLFKYRFKRKEKVKLSEKLIQDFPLFEKMNLNLDWIEGLT